jgi:DNA adenine methylase
MAKIGKLFDETPKVIKGGKLTPEELRERRNEQSRAKRARDKAKKAGVPPPAPAPPPAPPPPPKEEIKLSIEEIKPPPKAKRTKMTPEELKARRNEQTRKYREAKKKAQAQAPAPTPEPPTPEPSPTSVVDAPYGYTASGRIRKKPIKETTERRDRMPSRSVALQEEEKKRIPIDEVKKLKSVEGVTIFRWSPKRGGKQWTDSEKEEDVNYIASIRGESDPLVIKLRKLIDKSKLPNYKTYVEMQSQKKEEMKRSIKLNKQETQVLLDNYISDTPMPIPLGSAIPDFPVKRIQFSDGGYAMQSDRVSAFKLINDGFTDPNTYIMPFYTDIIYDYYERGGFTDDGDKLTHNAGFELDRKNTALRTAVWVPFGFGKGESIPRTLKNMKLGQEIGLTGYSTYSYVPSRTYYESKDPLLWINYMWQDENGKTIQRRGSKAVPMIPFYNGFKKLIDEDPRVYWFSYGGALLTLLTGWDNPKGLSDWYNNDWEANRGDNWEMTEFPDWDNWGSSDQEVTDAMSYFIKHGDGDIFKSASSIEKKIAELKTFETNMKQRVNITPLSPTKFYESYPTPDKSMQRASDNDVLNEVIVDGQKYYVDSSRNVYALTKEREIHRFIGVLNDETPKRAGEKLVLVLGDGSKIPWNPESINRDGLSSAYRSFFGDIVRLASKRNIQFCEDKIAMLESSSIERGKDIMVLYIYAHYYLSLETPMKLGDAYKVQKIDDYQSLAMLFEFFYATPLLQTIRENVMRTADEMLTKRTPIPKSSAISGEGLYAEWSAMPAGADKDAKAKELFGLVKGGKIPTTPEELQGAVDHGSTHLRPPFCRNGNKYPVKDILVKQFPEHKKYVEPFTGSSALFFNKPKAEQNVLNDLDKRMIQSLRWIKSAPPKDDPEWDKIEFKGKPYISQYKGDMRDNRYSGDRVANARAFFAKVPNSIIEKMAHFKLAGCAGFNGVFANKPSQIYKVSEKPLQRIENYLDLYKEYLKGVSLETKDYANIIKQHDGADTFFFIDPPYENTSSSLGYAEDKGFDFQRLRETLEKVKGKFMMTLNDSPNIRKIFQQFKINGFSAPNPWNTRDDKADRKPRKEITIRNY